MNTEASSGEAWFDGCGVGEDEIHVDEEDNVKGTQDVFLLVGEEAKHFSAYFAWMNSTRDSIDEE